jgi:hypothetical protein
MESTKKSNSFSKTEFDTLDDKINKADNSVFINKLELAKDYWSQCNLTLSYIPREFEKLKKQYYSLEGHLLINKPDYSRKKDRFTDDEIDLYLFLDDLAEGNQSAPVSLEEADAIKRIEERKNMEEHIFFFGEGNIESKNLILLKNPSIGDVCAQQVASGPARMILNEAIYAFGGLENCYVGYVFPFSIPKDESIRRDDGRASDLNLLKIKHIQHFYNLSYAFVRLMKPSIIIAIGKEVQSNLLASFSVQKQKSLREYGISEPREITIRSDIFHFAPITTTVFPLKHPFSYVDTESFDKTPDILKKANDWDIIIRQIKEKTSVTLGAFDLMKKEQEKKAEQLRVEKEIAKTKEDKMTAEERAEKERFAKQRDFRKQEKKRKDQQEAAERDRKRLKVDSIKNVISKMKQRPSLCILPSDK